MKCEFLASLFLDKGGVWLAELLHQSTGSVYFTLAPDVDRRGNRLRPGDKAWVTLGKDKKFYYYRIKKRTKIPAKEMKALFAEIDRLFPSTKSAGSASDT